MPLFCANRPCAHDGDRGHDHHRNDQRRADCTKEPQSDHQATADRRNRRGGGESAARTEAQRLQKTTRAVQSIPAEPPKKFLRAVGRNQQPQHDATDQ